MSMSAQEVFDIVAVHLLRQGQKSTVLVPCPVRGTICAYRGYNGTRCAAGILIRNDEYREGMEGNSWFAVVTAWPDLAARIGNPALVIDLQVLHDTTNPEEWNGGLRSIALIKGLSCQCIDDFLASKSEVQCRVTCQAPETHLAEAI